MACLLDANVFIEARSRHYRFDLCPAFREWSIEVDAANKVLCAGKIGNDKLAGGAAAHHDGFSPEPALFVPKTLGPVNDWSSAQNYDPLATMNFTEGACCRLVAHAPESARVLGAPA